jgi:hypothetical protein
MYVRNRLFVTDCLRVETPSTGGNYVWYRNAGIDTSSGCRAHHSRPEKAAGCVAKSLGKALNEFKRATSDIKESLEVNHNPDTVNKSHDALNDTHPKTENSPYL